MELQHKTLKAVKILLIVYLIFSIPSVCFVAYKVVNKLKQFFSGDPAEFVLDQEAAAAKYENEKLFTDYMFIAHAGGALFEDSSIYPYTNCKEAILYNYKKGYRVFELDFNLTSDGKLASVHDWEHARKITALPPPPHGGSLSLEEWKAQKIFEKYTPMDIDDVIAFMNTYKDIYVVTDTKAVDYDTITKEFGEIYRAAQEVDPDILKRIVPQIYNPQMLKTIYQIYPFPNVIYTLYQSLQSPDEVLKFVEKHPSIKAVTMWGYAATETFVANLSRINRPVYVHTINTFNEAFELYRRGVYGFYTDYLR